MGRDLLEDFVRQADHVPSFHFNRPLVTPTLKLMYDYNFPPLQIATLKETKN